MAAGRDGAHACAYQQASLDLRNSRLCGATGPGVSLPALRHCCVRIGGSIDFAIDLSLPHPSPRKLRTYFAPDDRVHASLCRLPRGHTTWSAPRPEKTAMDPHRTVKEQPL